MVIDNIEIVKYEPQKKEKKKIFDLKAIIMIHVGNLFNILGLYCFQFLPWYKEDVFINTDLVIGFVFSWTIIFIHLLYLKNKKK